MKYAHDSIFKKTLPLKLTEKLNASTFVFNFLILSSSVFYTFFLPQRSMYRALNEKGYWLIKMNIGKTLQTSAFSLIALNLIEKPVLHILLIMVGHVKSDIQNKQQITSTQRTFTENHGNPKRSIFSFTIANLVNKGILCFLIATGA